MADPCRIIGGTMWQQQDQRQTRITRMHATAEAIVPKLDLYCTKHPLAEHSSSQTQHIVADAGTICVMELR